MTGEDGRIGPLPPETLQQLLPMLGTIGITRLADITGLDRIGIPVIQAIRPQSLSNIVSQGKGQSVESAAVAAILESAETYFAERTDRFSSIIKSASALGIPEDRFVGFLRPDTSPDWYQTRTGWVVAEEWQTGKADWVPVELVHTAFVYPPLATDGIFAGSTSGLAAGLETADATVHALLECVERDALARALQTHGFLHRAGIDVDTIGDPDLRALIERVLSSGLLLGLWRLECVGGIPAVWCHIMERDDGEACLLPYPADGSAASLDPKMAVRGAVLEAVQSRLAAISGARDDMDREFYPRYPDWERIHAHRRLLLRGPKPIGFSTIEKNAPVIKGSWLETLRKTFARIPEMGVLIVRLDTTPLQQLKVVKIVVPTLKSYAG